MRINVCETVCQKLPFAWLFVWFALARWSAVPAFGEEPAKVNPVSASTNSVDSVVERQQLFQQLDKEFLAFEEHVNLLKKVVRVVKPTVVHIEAQKNDGDINSPRRGVVEEAGSGVLVDLKGKPFVVTSRHVVKNCALDKIALHLADGRVIRPLKVLEDKATDVAILAVNAPSLVTARIGDSDKAEIGDFVLAMGSPFGLSHSLSYGIISAKGRRDLDVGTDGVRFQDFLQTDAAINPGNSGGPLMNLRGEVIGINTAIASATGKNEGIGFTTPMNMVIFVASQLAERGSVTRAFLGVHLDSRFDSASAAKLGLPQRSGALISGITPESPAAQAGLKSGDVILKLNGTRIEDDNHLVNRISLMPIDSEGDVLVLRGGKSQLIKVKVGDRERYETQR